MPLFAYIDGGWLFHTLFGGKALGHATATYFRSTRQGQAAAQQQQAETKVYEAISSHMACAVQSLANLHYLLCRLAGVDLSGQRERELNVYLAECEFLTCRSLCLLAPQPQRRRSLLMPQV